MYKQIIIVRRDLNLPHGKMAAQCSHGSIAFLTRQIRRKAFYDDIKHNVFATLDFDPELYEQWICGEFTKVILEARNKNHLLKAKILAEEMGLVQDSDFFLIRDNCHTELTPEDEDGRTLTCIGFAPMDNDVIDKIGKKYQLYRG